MGNPMLTGFSDENGDSLSNGSYKLFNKEFSADSLENLIDNNLFSDNIKFEQQNNFISDIRKQEPNIKSVNVPTINLDLDSFNLI